MIWDSFHWKDKQCKQWFDQLLGPGAVEIFANKQ